MFSDHLPQAFIEQPQLPLSLQVRTCINRCQVPKLSIWDRRLSFWKRRRWGRPSHWQWWWRSNYQKLLRWIFFISFLCHFLVFGGMFLKRIGWTGWRSSGSKFFCLLCIPFHSAEFCHWGHRKNFWRMFILDRTILLSAEIHDVCLTLWLAPSLLIPDFSTPTLCLTLKYLILCGSLQDFFLVQLQWRLVF